MDIPAFIERCDRYCEAAGVKRVWLSKRLLHDTYRLEQLANGAVDIGVKRLARAVDDLSDLERARDAASSTPQLANESQPGAAA